MVEAAALPETFFTVWSNLVDRAGLKAGEVLLVHGGASGIGVAAIQLGRLVGARVFVTAGGAARCARCVELGAERAIDYRSEDFVAVVREATGGQGANVILDMVGGSYVGRNYEVAAVEGRIVQIAFLEGATVTADMTRLMVKRLVHTGSTLRARDPAFKAAIAAQLEARVWPAIAAGTMQPVIDATFPLAEAAAAHARLEAGGHVGKIVLTV
jgi:putative PIG3 family NAD(P)H quinone oxidoreductase